jgi:hypothetical protein
MGLSSPLDVGRPCSMIRLSCRRKHEGSIRTATVHRLFILERCGMASYRFPVARSAS